MAQGGDLDCRENGMHQLFEGFLVEFLTDLDYFVD